jgi:hypothetical protein
MESTTSKLVAPGEVPPLQTVTPTVNAAPAAALFGAVTEDTLKSGLGPTTTWLEVRALLASLSSRMLLNGSTRAPRT